jgi:type II restriction/modification system DNA methylase subunit YeeA
MPWVVTARIHNMPFTPQDFVSKWKRVTAREKQTYQEHFIDLCRLVGHQTPNEYDSTGTRFAFEMGVAKTSGGQGWADVAKLGYFGWEYKGKDSDLEKAYDQLLRYRDSLQNPPLLIISDINNIVIRTNYTNLPTRTVILTLDDLLKPDSIDILKTLFFDPEKLKPKVTIEGVTREAATKFAKLADNLRRYGNDPQEIAHFLIRLLFCLFAEDIGLLPENLFPRLLEQTRRNSNDFSRVLKQLFHAMSVGDYFGSEKILHFNGALFDNENILPLDSADMDIIADIDSLDWGAIEPSIFGTLFERGLDPAKRSQLGAHYTSKEDILLIVEPVLMAPLRREWAVLQVECQGLKSEADALTGKKRSSAVQKIGGKLRNFADKIASVKVLDPACGSANFLYVALRLLLDLQNEVINFSDEMGAGRFFVSVTPAQLAGIETNEYAHELAQMTIQIGYIQWLRDNGYGQPAEPILKPMRNILHMDAVLAYDEIRGPIEPEWPEADVIVGNPPFLGDKKMRSELGDKYVDSLRRLYGDRIPGQSDLVCYFFEKARAMIEQGEARRVGLLATNSIRGGANRRVLDRVKETGDIFWAQSNRDWILDSAAVNVSMVGFDNGEETRKVLDDRIFSNINSDLTGIADLTSAKQLRENIGIAFIGPSPHGPFDIEPSLAQAMLRSPNIHGRPNSDVVRPVISGIDIVRSPRSFWTIDFGLMPLEEAANYEMPFEYAKKNIFPVRSKNQRANNTDLWWQYERPRLEMREALSGLTRFISTPRVSKHRVFIWLPPEALSNDGTTVFAREDNYFFGVLQSRVHILWSLRLGTSLEDRPRYTPSTSFETFPFPWAPGAETQDDPHVQAIARAAKELVEQRDRWLNAEGLDEAQKKKRTLTNLYNTRPTWLDLAHKRLDEEVFAAYGWPSDLSDEEILEKLLSLNLERAKGE